MYIHIYTTATSTSDKETKIELWWYKYETESRQLFTDYHSILAKLCDYRVINSYTGDILEVENEASFTEKLHLLGVTIIGATTINLQSSTILMNHGVLTRKQEELPHFNKIYTICFGEYSKCGSFSDMSSLELPNKSGFIRVQDMKGQYIYLEGVQLSELDYFELKSITSNIVLSSWFSHMLKMVPYSDIVKSLEKIYNQNITPEEKESEKQENENLMSVNLADKILVEKFCEFEKNLKTMVIEKQENEKPMSINWVDRVWVEEFCDLYAEKDDKTDTLLSDIYQQYITASSWSKKETLSMSQFIKYLKDIPHFTVKRKAKGMVVTGYKFLLTYHSDMYNKCNYTSNLFKPISSANITYANKFLFKLGLGLEKKSHTELIEFSKREFYLEAMLLLGYEMSKYHITLNMIEQFINNPIIRPELYKYAEYIKEAQSPNSRICSADYVVDEKYGKCVIIFPFSTKHYKSTIPKNITSIQPFDPSIEPFDPFNCKIDSVYSNVNEYNCDGETDIKNVLAGFNK
jgi:hypothetical protein